MAKSHSTSTDIRNLEDLDDWLTYLIEIGEATRLMLALETQVPRDMVGTFMTVLGLLNEAMLSRLQAGRGRFIG